MSSKKRNRQMERPQKKAIGKHKGWKLGEMPDVVEMENERIQDKIMRVKRKRKKIVVGVEKKHKYNRMEWQYFDGLPTEGGVVMNRRSNVQAVFGRIRSWSGGNSGQKIEKYRDQVNFKGTRLLIKVESSRMSAIKEIRGMFAEIQEKLKEMNEKLEKNTEEVKLLREENNHLKQIVMEHSERIEMLERESKKRNLVIQGVDDAEGENPEVTKYKGTQIWISDDFTEKKLVPYLKEAQQKEEKAFLNMIN
ncbi:hypothetical protein FQA39_LY15694 [Lamprigera yunnana]|nr:hypothetical protein FQA39_LY15694 [Lamprigera yunnana]